VLTKGGEGRRGMMVAYSLVLFFVVFGLCFRSSTNYQLRWARHTHTQVHKTNKERTHVSQRESVLSKGANLLGVDDGGEREQASRKKKE
jgi:hypothetical protein